MASQLRFSRLDSETDKLSGLQYNLNAGDGGFGLKTVLRNVILKEYSSYFGMCPIIRDSLTFERWYSGLRDRSQCG